MFPWYHPRLMWAGDDLRWCACGFVKKGSAETTAPGVARAIAKAAGWQGS